MFLDTVGGWCMVEIYYHSMIADRRQESTPNNYELSEPTPIQSRSFPNRANSNTNNMPSVMKAECQKTGIMETYPLYIENHEKLKNVQQASYKTSP